MKAINGITIKADVFSLRALPRENSMTVPFLSSENSNGGSLKGGIPLGTSPAAKI